MDDTKRERPRINVGSNFQVTSLPIPHPKPQGKKRKRRLSPELDGAENEDEGDSSQGNEETFLMKEDHLWDPTVLNNCSTEEGMSPIYLLLLYV